MRIRPALLCTLLLSCTLSAGTCLAQQQKGKSEIMAVIKTTEGDISIRLFNSTPVHRDNFVRLADGHYYDSLLIHRVVRDFMIQTGDPESRHAVRFQTLGDGGPDYFLKPEINTADHFHRYGAVCAARRVDQVNPELLSSGSQFYIVTGKTYRSYQLHDIEDKLNEGRRQKLFNRFWAQYADSVMAMDMRNDSDGKLQLRKVLAARADSVIAAEGPISFSAEQMSAYMNVGGTPELDGDYTVFGQVTEGMKIVEKIQRVMTDANDRPLKDIRIISIRTVE